MVVSKNNIITVSLNHNGSLVKVKFHQRNLITELLLSPFLVVGERLPRAGSLFDLGCLLNIKSAIYIFADFVNPLSNVRFFININLIVYLKDQT